MLDLLVRGLDPLHAATKKSVLSHFSHVRLCHEQVLQAPLSTAFSQATTLEWLPCSSSLGCLLDPGMNPYSYVSCTGKGFISDHADATLGSPRNPTRGNEDPNAAAKIQHSQINI